MLHTLLLILAQWLWLLGLWLGCLAAGSWLLERFKLANLELSARLLLATGLGAALLSYALFTLAALHCLSLLTLALASGFWIGMGLFQLKIPARSSPPKNIVIGSKLWTNLLGLYLLLLIFFSAISVWTPAWDWDGTAYHLALPKIYLAAGGFIFRPDIYHNLFPQFTEMLYLLGLVFPFGIGAKLIHFAFGLLAAWSIWVLGRLSGLRSTAWLAAVIFYSQYLVHIESGTAFIDLATAAATGLAMVALLLAGRTSDNRWACLSSFFAGIAAATKWHGLITLALITGFLLLQLWLAQTAPAMRKWRQSLGLVLCGALPVLPYLLRAWIFGHNPIWPLGYTWLGGKFWNAQAAQAMTSLVAHFAGVGQGWRGLWQLPYNLLVAGQKFGVGGNELRAPLAGGMLLLLVGIGLRLAKPKPAGSSPWFAWYPWYVAAGLSGFFALWFFSSPQVRYLLPCLVLFAYSAGLVLQRLWAAGHWGKALAMPAAALLLWVHPPIHHDTLEQVKTGLGLESIEQFFSTRFNHYPACQFLNRSMKPRDCVLLFQENRGFYLDGQYLWGDPLNQALIDYRAMPTPEALAARLKELNVNWILYRTDVRPASDYYPAQATALMQAVISARGSVKYQDQAVTVYCLDIPPLPHTGK